MQALVHPAQTAQGADSMGASVPEQQRLARWLPAVTHSLRSGHT